MPAPGAEGCALESCSDFDPGDRSAGVALSIAAVGGCFAAVDLPDGDLSGGAALSIAAVGGCFFASFAFFVVPSVEVWSVPVVFVDDCAVGVDAF